MVLKTFSEIQLQQIADAVDATYTHKELSALLRDCGLAEKHTVENVHPKWQRVVVTLAERQQQDRCGNSRIRLGGDCLYRDYLADKTSRKPLVMRGERPKFLRYAKNVGRGMLGTEVEGWVS